MAKPGRPIGSRHQEDVRRKIQSSQLVNVLEKHVFGKHELSATQITAALGLLRKSIPDLSATEISGDPDRPVNMGLQVVGVLPQAKK